uniref:Ribosomal protein L31 n=1 Tax=Levilinea saccharolytica TaxID=229921 RepID=A0A0M9U2S3_9CHLR|nr:50S ribosomal protein L31 [Levilinea saccharolytica]GAP19016.1 ribosomal protein L31 [Levilinea saccharolytica]
MKKDTHPTYYPDAQVICSCGNTWTTGSTRKVIKTEICSKCHPFFTGQQQRLIDIEGQVDRFYRRLQARQNYIEDKKTREESRVSPARPITDLEMGSRPTEALAKAGITTVGEFMAKLAEGEQAVLDIAGFGRKSFIDMKKKLRQLGYELPGGEEAA